MGKARDIREAVERELSLDPLVGAAGITVRNVNGSVALTGTVPSYPQYLHAAEAARRAAGVTSVHNHLEVVLPPGGHVRTGAQRDAVVEAAWRGHAVMAVIDQLEITG